MSEFEKNATALPEVSEEVSEEVVEEETAFEDT